MISNSRMYQVSGFKKDPLTHDHGGFAHSHAHGADHAHGDMETPMDELLALMKFMVDHNDAHAQELATLADQLQEAGKKRAYSQIMDAVSDFDMANATLNAVLQNLQSEL